MWPQRSIPCTVTQWSVVFSESESHLTDRYIIFPSLILWHQHFISLIQQQRVFMTLKIKLVLSSPICFKFQRTTYILLAIMGKNKENEWNKNHDSWDGPAGQWYLDDISFAASDKLLWSPWNSNLQKLQATRSNSVELVALPMPFYHNIV